MKIQANAALYAYDDNNQITAGPGSSYTFEAGGNLASRSDASTFTHDEVNRLVQFQLASTSATYLHDAFGRRIRKTVNGATTWFVWDDERLIAQHDASGVGNKWYAYLPGEIQPRQMIDAAARTTYMRITSRRLDSSPIR